jgi:hypothetical protein
LPSGDRRGRAIATALKKLLTGTSLAVDGAGAAGGALAVCAAAHVPLMDSKTTPMARRQAFFTLHSPLAFIRQGVAGRRGG